MFLFKILRCDDKNRCYIAINKDFEGLCSENTDNKHANFVYSCSEPEKGKNICSKNDLGSYKTANLNK